MANYVAAVNHFFLLNTGVADPCTAAVAAAVSGSSAAQAEYLQAYQQYYQQYYAAQYAQYYPGAEGATTGPSNSTSDGVTTVGGATALHGAFLPAPTAELEHIPGESLFPCCCCSSSSST